MAFDITGFEDWLSSEKGTLFIKKQNNNQILKKKRYERFENWLKLNNFDELMSRLILEINNKDIDNIFIGEKDKIYPNRKLRFIIDYVHDNLNLTIINELDNEFPNQIREFQGYYFQMTWGQGVVVDIYKINDLKHLLRI